ncbi:MAG: class I SAM-dependent methyltransferase [Dehalococcoidales bacterium]|nr:class I SAM-dependent methyltransferase [Dehalococcoidales bacterium]
MEIINIEKYKPVINRIEAITGKSASDITIRLCETQSEYISLVYEQYRRNLNYVPDYMRVLLDSQNKIITTYDKENINLYLFYLINGKFNNMHHEWFDLFSCYARAEFCAADEIVVNNTAPFPQILFTDSSRYTNAKAHLFADMTERFGFEKMVEWLETPDLLFYYEPVFGKSYEKHIENVDISLYEKILHGQCEADENTRLSLWIDSEYRDISKLVVFYSSWDLTKAAIKYGNSVLGIVNIKPDGVISYVTDYQAWMRRRASGYARNNPYNEADFMKKVLSYTENENPKILEIGIGSGRIAKPFVESGYEYYGIDILNPMIEECREVLGRYSNLYVLKHDIKGKLPFEDNTFDILIESRVLNVEQDPFVMSEINRVLKTNGTAFIGVQDNYELWDQNSVTYKNQSNLIWNVYKQAYYNFYNISDKRTNKQNMYGLELPRNEYSPKIGHESNFVVPKPTSIFTREEPFSTCEYEFDYIKCLRDNKYHMAFFRLEPLFEPCGTDFFASMEQTAHSAFENDRGKCVRGTELKIYKYV